MKETLIKISKLVLIAIGSGSFLIFLFFGYKAIPLEELKLKYANENSSFICINNINIHYRDEGNSNNSVPLVLMHGTGSSLHTFNDWSSALSKNHRVIRMDLPAYGLTGPFPNRNYTLNNYVDFIKSFLDALHIKKCILVGNSLGGCIAWNFTTKHNVMVEKLILIDASGYPNKSKSTPLAFRLAQTPILKNILTIITPRFIAKKSIENVYADKHKVTKTLVDRYFELTLRKGNRQAFIDRLAVKPDTTSYKKITSIKQPTLILWGERDQLIPVDMAQQYHRDLSHSTLVILKNTGHVPMEEYPDQSLKFVYQFLKN